MTGDSAQPEGATRGRAKLEGEHTFPHEEGQGTCTCGVGPWCACGYCQACGRYDFGFPAPLLPKQAG